MVYEKRYQNGLRLVVKRMEGLLSVSAGILVGTGADTHYSYGNYVVIDHGGGKSTLYAHANKLNCKVGDVVKQGDVISYVGTTGNSYGNHLHFEVRVDGQHTNPMNYVNINN